MSTTAPKPVMTPLPVQLSAPEFAAFLLPHVSRPKRGPKCTLGYDRVFNPHHVGALHRHAVEVPARAARARWETGHVLHDRLQSLCQGGRCWGAVAGVGGQGAACGGRAAPRPPYPPWRRDQHRSQTRGMGLGSQGPHPRRGKRSSPLRPTMALS